MAVKQRERVSESEDAYQLASLGITISFSSLSLARAKNKPAAAAPAPQDTHKADYNNKNRKQRTKRAKKEEAKDHKVAITVSANEGPEQGRLLLLLLCNEFSECKRKEEIKKERSGDERSTPFSPEDASSFQ